MRLYISGKMSGVADHNFPAFREAAALLTSVGYEVIDPSENFGGATDRKRSEYMRLDIEHILQADAIAVLPDWSESTGAQLEVAIAEELGLVVDSVGWWSSLSPLSPGTLLNVGGRAYPRRGEPTPQQPPDDLVLSTYKQYQAGVVSADAVLARFGPQDKTNPTEPETILQEAQRLVHGDRGHNYGHPIDDFSRTAAMWTAMWLHKMKAGEEFGPRDVALGMIAVKMSRETNRPKRDNRVDICGYAETLDMVDARLGETK